VSAPPEGGKANAAVVAMLAAALGVPANTVRIVRGATSPRKVVEIDDLSDAEVRARLSATAPRERRSSSEPGGR
jgi:uncharacterized protein YggU (UPF0235/DUF167 family)